MLPSQEAFVPPAVLHGSGVFSCSPGSKGPYAQGEDASPDMKEKVSYADVEDDWEECDSDYESVADIDVFLGSSQNETLWGASCSVSSSDSGSVADFDPDIPDYASLAEKAVEGTLALLDMPDIALKGIVSCLPPSDIRSSIARVCKRLQRITEQVDVWPHVKLSHEKKYSNIQTEKYLENFLHWLASRAHSVRAISINLDPSYPHFTSAMTRALGNRGILEVLTLCAPTRLLLCNRAIDAVFRRCHIRELGELAPQLRHLHLLDAVFDWTPADYNALCRKLTALQSLKIEASPTYPQPRPLDKIPTALNCCAALKEMSLSSTSLHHVSYSMVHLTQLSSLSFHGCGFTSDGFATHRLPCNITKLVLSKNRLTKFPDDVLRQCPSLCELDCSHNEIRNDGEGVLQHGDAEHCFYSHGYLTWLDLSNNNLKRFPASLLGCLPSLHTLNLRNNLIMSETLPNVHADIQMHGMYIPWSCCNLDLSNNQMQHVPTDFLQFFYHLQWLDLASNKIMHIGAFPANLTTLTTLILTCNHDLQTLPCNLRHLPNLKKLLLACTGVDTDTLKLSSAVEVCKRPPPLSEPGDDSDAEGDTPTTQLLSRRSTSCEGQWGHPLFSSDPIPAPAISRSNTRGLELRRLEELRVRAQLQRAAASKHHRADNSAHPASDSSEDDDDSGDEDVDPQAAEHVHRRSEHGATRYGMAIAAHAANNAGATRCDAPHARGVHDPYAHETREQLHRRMRAREPTVQPRVWQHVIDVDTHPDADESDDTDDSAPGSEASHLFGTSFVDRFLGPDSLPQMRPFSQPCLRGSFAGSSGGRSWCRDGAARLSARPLAHTLPVRTICGFDACRSALNERHDEPDRSAQHNDASADEAPSHAR